VALDPAELDRLARDELIARAQRLGIQRAEVMTRVELKDEIVRRSALDAASRKRARGWLGVARDLVASLIEEGLNLPAKLVRTGGLNPTRIRHQPPVATVTLAEIYSTQGHARRAIAMLDEVLDKEPDHAAARALRDRLAAAPAPVLEREREPERESEPESEPAPVLEPEREPKREPEREREPESEPAPVLEPEREPEPEAPVLTPARGRDAVITIRTERGETFVYWEVTEETLARARSRWPGGRAVIELVAFLPRWDGAERIERELSIEAPVGRILAPPFGAGSVVRAAAGWRDAGAFHPLIVGVELGRANGPEQELPVEWAPSGRRTPDPEARRRAAAELESARASASLL
jgi:hypothetical protein